MIDEHKKPPKISISARWLTAFVLISFGSLASAADPSSSTQSLPDAVGIGTVFGGVAALLFSLSKVIPTIRNKEQSLGDGQMGKSDLIKMFADSEIKQQKSLGEIANATKQIADAMAAAAAQHEHVREGIEALRRETLAGFASTAAAIKRAQ